MPISANTDVDFELIKHMVQLHHGECMGLFAGSKPSLTISRVAHFNMQYFRHKGKGHTGIYFDSFDQHMMKCCIINIGTPVRDIF
jgi:hypothetical protein